MNCKIDDLVRYVGRVVTPGCYGWIGRVVKRLPPDCDGDVGWEVSPPIPGGNIWKGHFYSASQVKDSSLRPIRDPGDDAQDETLSWKDVPFPAIQPELLEKV